MPDERLVFAHGFTQTARSWDRCRALVAERAPSVETTAIDLPGHGSATDGRGDLWQAAEHLTAAGGPGVYVGYSMGGRVALHAALLDPGAVHRLVLIGATAGIDDADERAERRSADEALADRIEAVGVDQFVDEWLMNPLFAGLTDDTDQRADRRRNTAVGLASSLRLTGTGTQQPLWRRLDEIAVPVLVLVGEHDPKFRALGERLVAGLPDAQLRVVAGAGHSVHLEQPDETIAVLGEWLGWSAADGQPH